MSTSTRPYLVFDAYGTLLKVNAKLPNMTPEQEVLSAKIQELWRVKQLQYTWLLSLMNRWMDFNQVTRNALDYALDHYSVDDDDLKKRILGIFDHPVAFDDAQAFLRQAQSSNLTTAILSNGEPSKLKESVEIAGIDAHLDQILSASQVETFKPSPKVYHLVLDHFQCEAREVRFFSSNPWDIAGAKSFGFTTIWLNRQDVPFEQLGVAPDYTYGSFADFQVNDII
ncbi:MAG: haloacid dehalogenase type II [Bacteroidota bacterium]